MIVLCFGSALYPYEIIISMTYVDLSYPDLEYERKGNEVLDSAEQTSQDIPLLVLNMLW